MSFNPQNDSGSVENANSHVTYEYFLSYFSDRGIDYSNTGTYPEATVKAALVRATDYQNYKYRYRGEKADEDQGTAFPRLYIYDIDGYLVSGIPEPVKKDCCELAAYMIDNSYTTLYMDIAGEDSGIKKKSSKIDVIQETTEYFASIKFNSLTVGNAQNVVSCGYLTFSSGIYL